VARLGDLSTVMGVSGLGTVGSGAAGTASSFATGIGFSAPSVAGGTNMSDNLTRNEHKGYTFRSGSGFYRLVWKLGNGGIPA